MGLSIVILAAGQGKRLHSDLPKVLHALAGKPLLEHVYQAAAGLSKATLYVIYGHGGERVPTALAHLPVRWIEQPEQLGTGHAVAQALPFIPSADTVLVLYGDVPLIAPETLQRLLDASARGRFGLLTAKLDKPAGYGRIVRNDDGAVERIVEEKDAGEKERAIDEVNTGILAVSAGLLKGWTARLDNRNAQGEYYLTDVIAMAVADKVPIDTIAPGSPFEVMGVNDRIQLAELERHYQRLQAQRLMREGVTLLDPARFDLRGELGVGRDVVIDINVVIEGRVRLGNRVTIGPNAYIRDTEMADDVTVLPHCVIEGAVIGQGSRIGPFSRVRPGTLLAEEVHIGNFVEIKKSKVNRGSKINHLSYVGDADVGKNVNIGAGTITCNYDGANKHRTSIGDDVFIGSDTQLIAPVRVGEGATIGAGTTVASDAPAGMLTIGRARQMVIPNWQRPQKKP